MIVFRYSFPIGYPFAELLVLLFSKEGTFMTSAKTEQIPENESKYWTMGIGDEEPVTQTTVSATWQKYLSLHKQGSWLQALMVVNRLIAYDRQQPEVWRVKAKLHGMMGHSVSCICAIEILLQLVPRDLDALRMQALFLYCHHSHESALSICESVLGSNPTHADFWALKADILSSRGKQTEAEKACKRALQIKPDCIAALRLQSHLQTAA
jgi:tetratricopeptide (TPR) repeat protein